MTRIIANERVIRISHDGSATIQQFLRHLRVYGIECVPTPLDLNPPFEELTYLPGVCFTPTEPRTLDAWRDDHLEQLGRILRTVHDASQSFLTYHADAPWFPFAEPCTEPDAICHNDLGPWNVPIDGDKLSIIDWEMAAPGKAIWDIAHVAWNWVPFFPPEERRRMGVPKAWRADERLSRLLEAYGGSRWDRGQILREMIQRQTRVLELSTYARASQEVLLQNWAKVESGPIEADRQFVQGLLARGI